jgi:hypothetical protein
MRTRVQNALHAIALAHGVRRGHMLWNRDGHLSRRGTALRDSRTEVFFPSRLLAVGADETRADGLVHAIEKLR